MEIIAYKCVCRGNFGIFGIAVSLRAEFMNQRFKQLAVVLRRQPPKQSLKKAQRLIPRLSGFAIGWIAMTLHLLIMMTS